MANRCKKKRGGRVFQMIWVCGFWTLAGCTGLSISAGTSADSQLKAGQTSTTSGDIVIEKYNEKGVVIERHKVSGGASQGQNAEASAKTAAASEATAKSVSILLPIAIIAGALLAVIGISEIIKIIARLSSGTGL